MASRKNTRRGWRSPLRMADHPNVLLSPSSGGGLVDPRRSSRLRSLEPLVAEDAQTPVIHDGPNESTLCKDVKLAGIRIGCGGLAYGLGFWRVATLLKAQKLKLSACTGGMTTGKEISNRLWLRPLRKLPAFCHPFFDPQTKIIGCCVNWPTRDDKRQEDLQSKFGKRSSCLLSSFFLTFNWQLLAWALKDWPVF